MRTYLILAALVFLACFAWKAQALTQTVDWSPAISRPDSLFPMDTTVVRVRTDVCVPAADSVGLQYSLDDSTWTWVGGAPNLDCMHVNPSFEPVGFLSDPWCNWGVNPGKLSSICWSEMNYQVRVIAPGTYYFRTARKAANNKTPWEYSNADSCTVNNSTTTWGQVTPAMIWSDSTYIP